MGSGGHGDIKIFPQRLITGALMTEGNIRLPATVEIECQLAIANHLLT